MKRTHSRRVFSPWLKKIETSGKCIFYPWSFGYKGKSANEWYAWPYVYELQTFFCKTLLSIEFYKSPLYFIHDIIVSLFRANLCACWLTWIFLFIILLLIHKSVLSFWNIQKKNYSWFLSGLNLDFYRPNFSVTNNKADMTQLHW